MDTRDFLANLRHSRYRDRLVHVAHLPARPPRYADLTPPLANPLPRLLRRQGVERLYTHQAEAIQAARAGRDVVVCTGTASGKTLCYILPTLEALIKVPRARALFIYPTKALAQDQLRALRTLLSGGLKHVLAATYDGDTSRGVRSQLRRSAAILLTNPDMLHYAILPNHGLWAEVLANLRYVVLDEAHAYRGIFGSHVAAVVRRLRRLCQAYDSNPQFICCSATIANPEEHGERLIGRRPVVIDSDGAPQAGREFAFWNPPFIDRACSARRSANVEGSELFAELLQNGIRSITFTRARVTAELILRYTRQLLAKSSPELAQQIAAYRAGYRPEERRAIEAALFSGELLGVTATNALELGIDVGSLEATVLVGYPGSVASTWQQAGRAGRGKRQALSVLIGQDNPLDQYFMRHPEGLLGQAHEHALLDPSNVYVLEKHLPCAAYERPLTSHDEELFGPGYVEAMIRLEKSGTLVYRQERWYVQGACYPAQGTSIRSLSSHSYALLDESRGYQLLEEVEETSAFSRIYPGAIYLHQGDSYLVTHLDPDQRVAHCRPVDVPYYTLPRELDDVHIIRSWDGRELGACQAFLGQVRVGQQVIGYWRRQQFSEEVLAEVDLELPPQSFATHALWFDVPEALGREIGRHGGDFAGALHAVEHAAIGILPLFALCDRNDIGGVSTPAHPDTGLPQVFIYDAAPGGMGIAEKGFALLPELWRATLDAIQHCPCAAGCPSCVQSPKCGNNNQPLDKRGAALVLQRLLG